MYKKKKKLESCGISLLWHCGIASQPSDLPQVLCQSESVLRLQVSPLWNSFAVHADLWDSSNLLPPWESPFVFRSLVVALPLHKLHVHGPWWYDVEQPSQLSEPHCITAVTDVEAEEPSQCLPRASSRKPASFSQSSCTAQAQYRNISDTEQHLLKCTD